MAHCTRRAEPLVLLMLPAIYAWLVFSGDFRIDPDSYYHFGCARLYAERFWLPSFPWLEYTTLGPHFPNVHFLQHLLLIPFAALWPVVGLKLAIVVFTTALFVSIAAVLRRWKVPHAELWTVLGALASTLLITISVTLKGATTFLIILVWLIDALSANAWRRAFLLAWLSVYAYVGAPILLPLVAVFVVVRRLWDGLWDTKTPIAIVAGLALGLLINPFWPDHLQQIGSELYYAFARPDALVPGVFRGGEWISITGRDVLRFAGVFLTAWLLLLLRLLGGGPRVSASLSAGVVVAMGLLGASLVAAKFFHLFFVVSLLFLPSLAKAQSPWPRWVTSLALVGGLVAAALCLRGSWRDIKTEETRAAGPSDYQALGEFLAERTDEGQVIVAPWDDFPGLFFFNTQNHYVSGMNNDFLRRADARRFDAYRYLYDGKVSDPDKLLPMFFGSARHIVARSQPRNSGEKLLIERMQSQRTFTALVSPSPMFLVWELLPDQPTGKNPSQ